MLTIGGQRVFVGGFHDHWCRNGTDNPALLMAAMNYHHLDFICLMDGLPMDSWIRDCIETYCPHMRIFLGQELCYSWGHVITVGGRAPDPQILNQDYRSVLATLKRHCVFVAMAHPMYSTTHEQLFLTGELDRLLDDDLIDAVQPGLSTEETVWIQGRLAKGRRTPVVEGWDAHMLSPLRNLPTVLYSRERPPDGHIDTCSGNRTLVFADDNSLPALRIAVRAGRSLIENATTGEFVGPPELAEFLLANGYRKAIKELDAQRDRVSLTLGGPLVGGGPAQFNFSEPGVVRLPGTLESPMVTKTDSAGVLQQNCLRPVLDRDRTYLPVVHIGAAGYSRVFAAEVHHPIQMEAWPAFDGEQMAVDIVSKRPFQGTVKITVEGMLPSPVVVDPNQWRVSLPGKTPPRLPMPYILMAEMANGIRREIKGILTFVHVPRFAGNWTKVPEIAVDNPVFTPTPGSTFAANRPWPGSDAFSARVRLAWTNEALLCRAQVCDPIHFQPFTDHMYYEADSLQVAVDPLLRREETHGAIAAYVVASTQAGPQVIRWLVPDATTSPRVDPPPGNTHLREKSSEYMTVEKWHGGLVYTMRLPWADMLPSPPDPGMRMGLFLWFANNNGQGMLDVLEWPKPIPGMFTVPSKWGIITLAD